MDPNFPNLSIRWLDGSDRIAITYTVVEAIKDETGTFASIRTFVSYTRICPAGTTCYLYNVAFTSMQHHDVAPPLI